MPRLSHAQAPHFTLDELRRVLGAATEPYRTLYWLVAETGMRAGEVCALRWEDVDLANCEVCVQRSVWNGVEHSPKTQTGTRRFTISAQLATHLGTRSRTASLVFPSEAGTALRPNNILRRHLHPLLASFGISRRGLHAFRHAMATLMDTAGVPMKVRQERLGHTNAEITMNLYTHPVADADRAFATWIGNELTVGPNGPN